MNFKKISQLPATETFFKKIPATSSRLAKRSGWGEDLNPEIILLVKLEGRGGQFWWKRVISHSHGTNIIYFITTQCPLSSFFSSVRGFTSSSQVCSSQVEKAYAVHRLYELLLTNPEEVTCFTWLCVCVCVCALLCTDLIETYH